MKKLLTVSGIVILASYFALPVSAHFPARDGSIKVELHIEPGDDPIAKKPFDLEFVMEEQNPDFVLQNCGCVFTILQGTKTILTENLPDATKSTAFTFPTKDIYHLKLSNQAHSFTWDFQITKQASLFDRLQRKLLSLWSQLRHPTTP